MSKQAQAAAGQYVAERPGLLTGAEITCLLGLAFYHNWRTGLCCPGNDTLAARMGHPGNKGYAKRLLDQLEAKGVIECEEGGKGGRGHRRQVNLVGLKVATPATFPRLKVAKTAAKGCQTAPQTGPLSSGNGAEPTSNLATAPVGGAVARGGGESAPASPHSGPALGQEETTEPPLEGEPVPGEGTPAALRATWQAAVHEAEARERDAAAERERDRLARAAAAREHAAAAAAEEADKRARADQALAAHQAAEAAEQPADPPAPPAAGPEQEVPAAPPLVAYRGQGQGGGADGLPLVRQVNPPDHQADPAAGEPAQIGAAVDAVAAGLEAAG